LVWEKETGGGRTESSERSRKLSSEFGLFSFRRVAWGEASSSQLVREKFAAFFFLLSQECHKHVLSVCVFVLIQQYVNYPTLTTTAQTFGQRHFFYCSGTWTRKHETARFFTTSVALSSAFLCEESRTLSTRNRLLSMATSMPPQEDSSWRNLRSPTTSSCLFFSREDLQASVKNDS